MSAHWPNPFVVDTKERGVAIQTSVQKWQKALPGVEDKETVLEKVLNLLPWAVGIFLLIYFSQVVRPILNWLGIFIDRKTRSQAMAAADLIQGNQLTPEKQAEIEARKKTDRAYRKALEKELKERSE